ncbi:MULTISPECIES: aspartate aminotransferase family protein [Helicobacter]|uniref:Aspartate aminotransferase family protein n=1 Tax=Helicobacter ibis TaxID=2962633 RepID=A0ABT4VH97_9HELI|nr:MULTISPECIES: aspartate aminotransferase family protein [Helicobacter]MDA3967698.1 aspartate aminotransferase family protein [Helicobacter sp. WB40]MDA3969416.1 aspartate aminotransferase family protein [Helicobacter ibis]
MENMDLKYVMHTYARNYTYFVRGKNATLFDKSGLDYIDFTSGIGVCSVGHGNKKLSKTIEIQSKNLIHTSNLYAIEPQAKLAKKLVKLSGYDMRVFFSNSGAEANECAIKIARKFGNSSNRYEIITLDSSFHGRTITTLKATAQEKMHKFFNPFPDGFVYAKDLDDIRNKITDKTCAVMLELIQGEGGISPLDKHKVQSIAKYLKKKNILLILDEVQSGIYRSGELFASTLYDITPDIITTAKGLGGGVPIGATLSTLKDIFSFGDHGSTFGGNFLSTSAALTTLDILSNLKENHKLDKTIKYFNKKLEKFQKEYCDIFTQKVGIGLMLGLRMKDENTLKTLIHKAHKNRVLILKSGKNTARFLPPLTISKDEINEGFKRLKKSII